MAIPSGGNNRYFACLRIFLRHQQRNLHAFAEESEKPAKTLPEVISKVIEAKPRVRVDMQKWRKLDSKSMGVEVRAIPSGPLSVMKILRRKGFDAFLVGGCVRDIILKKTPKDFDIITNATLSQIKKNFHRAIIVGRRFPICMVHMRDSVTEVSSFQTVANNGDQEEEMNFSEAPCGCQIKDFTLWRNSLKRDFTINSLFFDPFLNKVYDYSSGITDLKFLKLRTIVPAKVSFEEDCARILRGLRIAARLGLSFSRDTETALLKLSPSIVKLAKARLLMEMNYMLSYGAAVPSLLLLQRFNLLEILLPLQAVYLGQQGSTEVCKKSTMLMKLFSNLDKEVCCDHPSDCRLWVGVLAFHLTLVNKPQDAFVVLTLASILYHGEWKEGIKYARENANVQAQFRPELSGASGSKSDKELADAVSQLANFVQASTYFLTEEEALLDTMSKLPTSSSSGLIFIPRRIGQDVAELFHMLVMRNPPIEKKRESFDVHYQSLGLGSLWETRFVLGKVILETMGCKTWKKDTENPENSDSLLELSDEDDNNDGLSNLIKKHVQVKKSQWKNNVREHDTEAKKSDLETRLSSVIELLEGDGISVEKKDATVDLFDDVFASELGDIVLEESPETNEGTGESTKENNRHTRKRKGKSNGDKSEAEKKPETLDLEETKQEKIGNKKKQQKRESRISPGEKKPELAAGTKAREKKRGKTEESNEDWLTSVLEGMLGNSKKKSKSSSVKVAKERKASKNEATEKERGNDVRTTNLIRKMQSKRGNGFASEKNGSVRSDKPIIVAESPVEKEGEKQKSENRSKPLQEDKNKDAVKGKETRSPLSSLFR